MLLPAVLINSLGDSIDLFLISMGYNGVVFFLQLVVIPIHLLSCWLLVKHFEYEIVGASLANNITAILTFAGQVVYVTNQKEIK